MSDPRKEIHALMRGLALRTGLTQQSIAKEMSDFWHPTGNCGNDFDTADLSRKMNGTRQWAIADLIALQMLAGSSRVSDAISAMVRPDTSPDTSPLSILHHARRLVKEGGEAAGALLSLGEDGSVTDALSELIDIREAVSAAIRDLEGDA